MEESLKEMLQNRSIDVLQHPLPVREASGYFLSKVFYPLAQGYRLF